MSQKIQFLDEIEHVQTRPGMYVGATDTPRTLVRELVDNALDEFLNGYATKIAIEYDPARGVYTVKDNGRGLPLYPVTEYENQKAAKLLFMKLFSGGKFTKENYKYSSGLHGVGLTVVNALSEAVHIETVDRDTKEVYTLTLSNGRVVSENSEQFKRSTWSTQITCHPNKNVFKTHKTVIDTLPLSLAKEMFPKGSITINGHEVSGFKFQDAVDKKLLGNHVFHLKGTLDSVIFDLYFAWSDKEYNYLNKGTVNFVPCNNGWHERVAKRCIGKALSEYAEPINSDDVNYGLRVFVNLFTQSPVFTSQSKDRLSHVDDEPKGFEEGMVKAILSKIKQEKVAADAVVKKLVAYKKQMEKLSDQEFIDSVVRKGNDKRSSMGVGAGVWDCTTKGPKAELFIVEGRSAAGHIRKTRNKAYQAVLPLQGKPLNAAAADDIKIILGAKDREGNIGESELVQMVNTIGAGITPNIDLNAMRYGKIIVAADADADGAQIANLIIGALIYLVPEIIEAGHVYEAIAPLYEQDGKYYYDVNEINTKKSFSRFKGLGSMNADEVYPTLVNPKTRKLRRVTLSDRAGVLEILQTAREKKRIMVQSGIVEE